MSPTEMSKLPEIIPAGRERTGGCLSLTIVWSLGVTQWSLMDQTLQSGKQQIIHSVRSPISSWWGTSMPAPSYGMNPRWWVRASLAVSKHWPGAGEPPKQSRRLGLGRSRLDMGDLCSRPALPPAGLLTSNKWPDYEPQFSHMKNEMRTCLPWEENKWVLISKPIISAVPLHTSCKHNCPLFTAWTQPNFFNPISCLKRIISLEGA